MQFGRGKAKLFFAGGKGFCFASALFCGDLVSAAQEGAGGMRGAKRWTSEINFATINASYI